MKRMRKEKPTMAIYPRIMSFDSQAQAREDGGTDIYEFLPLNPCPSPKTCDGSCWYCRKARGAEW